MTAKRFTIVDEQFISYYGGTGHKISNGECGFWLWHDKEETQKVCDKLNSILDENEQLKSDKEHLMGCLIRFFGYDDEDIDYNLNRESNREYGKQYYSMKEETKKELEE